MVYWGEVYYTGDMPRRACKLISVNDRFSSGGSVVIGCVGGGGGVLYISNKSNSP